MPDEVRKDLTRDQRPFQPIFVLFLKKNWIIVRLEDPNMAGLFVNKPV